MSHDPNSDVQDAVGDTVRARNGPWRDPDSRSKAMQSVAASLRAGQQVILRTASDETHLTIDELRPELERMIGTIRLFAEMVASREWVRAAIDTRSNDRAQSIGPNHDLRSMLIPLGDVVAVFGASNFPLAYGVCGGDTASAWAAGCTVVVKEHPGHPKTGRLLHQLAREGLKEGGMDPGVLGYVHDDESGGFDVARHLVHDENICAVGFTGSVQGGLAIERLAQARARPIPVFAEMSSTNVVFITAAALAERGDEIARELSQSLLARFGQQCTCPGLMLLGAESPLFANTLSKLIESTGSRRMLTDRVRDHFLKRIHEIAASSESTEDIRVLAQARSVPNAEAAVPMIFEADLMELRRSTLLTQEMFGPAAVIAVMNPDSLPDIEMMLATLGGQLTASVYTSTKTPETPEVQQLVELLMRSVGRIIFNGPPTGVRVATATVHGGPFPATNRPEMTAVGPLAIERWCRRICYQNAPDELLPEELRDSNPRRIGRTVDGVWVPPARE